MIVVPAAAYWQGSDDSSALALSMEKPRRLITIDEPFAVSVHEITMAEWDLCASTSRVAHHNRLIMAGEEPIARSSWSPGTMPKNTSTG